MVEAAERGDFAAARAVHTRLLPLMQVNFVEVEPGPGEGGDGGDGPARRGLPAADGAAASPSRERRSCSVLNDLGLARRRAGVTRLMPSTMLEIDIELRRRRRVRRSRRGARGVRAAARGAVGRHGARRGARRVEPDRLARQHLGEAGHPARLPVRRHRRRVDGSRPLAVLRQGHAAAEASGLAAGVRIVPGGSAVRDGAYLAPGVICMPPMYVNIGAWVGEQSLIDSHALVGSCAQVGARVHVSAGAQIGGVIEPVGALPVIVEDDVLDRRQHRHLRGRGHQGARGDRRRHGAHRIDAGLRPRARRDHQADGRPAAGRPGRRGRRARRARGHGGQGPEWGLSLATPVIVKYRDSRTDTRTELEAWIR